MRGFEILPLPEGHTADTAWMLIKMRDSDGGINWCWRSPGISNQEELLGALLVQVELLKQRLVDDWS